MPRPSVRASRRLAAVVLLAASVAPPAAAQDPTSPAPAAPPDRAIAASALGAAADSSDGWRLDVTALDLSGVATFGDLLARVPGVTVQRSSGTAGTGARVRVRGTNSVRQTDGPLLVVDGVRADATQQAFNVGAGGQAPSRLDEIPVEEVATIEVLRGPATAALYGAGADRGVIVVTTRAHAGGRAGGPPQWRAYATTGLANSGRASFPTSYAAVDTRQPAGSQRCLVRDALAGRCTADRMLTREPFTIVDPFRAAPEHHAGAGVRGSLGRVAYGLSGDVLRRTGVYESSGANAGSARASVAARASRALSVSATGAYTARDLAIPVNDGSVAGVLYRALTDDPLDTTTVAEDVDSLAFGLRYAPTQRAHAYTGGVSAQWAPAGWLTAVASVGTDQTRRAERWDRPGIGYDSQTGTIGPTTVRAVDTLRTRLTTAALRADVRYGVLGARATSGAGAERVRQEASFTSRVGPADSSDCCSAGRSWWQRGDYTGLFATQRLAWSERVELAGVVRRDEPRWSGEALWQGGASLAWTSRGGDGLARLARAERVRLRTGYGDVAARTFPDGSLDLVIVPPWYGAPLPEYPTERTREVEAGADASYQGGRFVVGATGYDKRTRDVVISGGFSMGGFPTGVVRNRGVEIAAHARPLAGPRLSWNVSVSAAANRNRVESLSGFTLVTLDSTFGQYAAAGQPLGVYIDRRFRYADANGDGMIAATEVQTDSVGSSLGTPYPTRELSLSTSLTVRRTVTVSALADYRGGMRLWNGTERTRCLLGVCRAANDPTAPLDEQARLVAFFGPGSGLAGYVEDASFLKVRELSVAVDVPARWAAAVRAPALRATLAGRNLATFTGYTGADPEVNAYGQHPFAAGDHFTQPQLRTFVLRVDVGR